MEPSLLRHRGLGPAALELGNVAANAPGTACYQPRALSFTGSRGPSPSVLTDFQKCLLECCANTVHLSRGLAGAQEPPEPDASRNAHLQGADVELAAGLQQVERGTLCSSPRGVV